MLLHNANGVCFEFSLFSFSLHWINSFFKIKCMLFCSVYKLLQLISSRNQTWKYCKLDYDPCDRWTWNFVIQHLGVFFFKCILNSKYLIKNLMKKNLFVFSKNTIYRLRSDCGSLILVSDWNGKIDIFFASLISIEYVKLYLFSKLYDVIILFQMKKIKIFLINENN